MITTEYAPCFKISVITDTSLNTGDPLEVSPINPGHIRRFRPRRNESTNEMVSRIVGYSCGNYQENDVIEMVVRT